MVVCGDPPDFWAVTGGAIGKADPAIMRTMSQLLMHDSSRGSEHGDWYRCAASESALVGHRLAQAQHPTLLQARIVINSRLNLRCNTGQRSRRKNSWVAWVLREATGPKQENQRRRERHRFPRILRGYLLIRAEPRPSWRGLCRLIARATR